MTDSIDQFFDEWASQAAPLPGIAPEVQYLYRLVKVSRILAKRLDETCATFDITRSQFEAMAVLRRRHPEPLSAQKIMAASMLTSGSVTAMINQLLKAGLVKRDLHPTDARRIQVGLTRKGMKTIEAALAARIKDNTELANMLPEAERKHMNELMRTLLGAMESRHGGEKP